MLSFEFFPPKTAQGVKKLRQARQALYTLSPAFCSVTYGAGGSTQEGTFETVEAILQEACAAACHLSCIGATREKVDEQLRALKAMGVKRLVALRGDLPHAAGDLGDFRYASDLVAFIRKTTGDAFHVEVAAYPEVHPEAKGAQADLDAFVAKIEAGANSAITQYFFNPDAYFRFVDEVTARGLSHIPIVPGIMPITNAKQLLRFSENCGADIPRWIEKRLVDFADDLASIRAFGLDVVSQLCETLLRGGAPGLHFYTLNQSEPSLALALRSGLAKNHEQPCHLDS